MRSKKSTMFSVSWAVRLQSEETAETLLADLRNALSFSQNSPTDSQTSLESFAKEFVSFLLADECSTEERIKDLARTVFAFSDLISVALKELAPQILEATSESCKCKILWFLRHIPHPRADLGVLIIREKGSTLKISKKHRCHCVEKAWIEVSGLELSDAMLTFAIPYFVDELMDCLPNTEIFSDFLYKVFNKGGYLSVLSLAGIFKLIVRNNFEHPNFYSDVYFIISPSICYSEYGQKFFGLIDLILSSTHVPVYIITAFVKRLARVLLQAPINYQLPLLTSIKNILRRHEMAHSLLVNRENPATLQGDPYDENERDLQKCGASDSSLWEIRSIQQHWYKKVADKAQFIDQKSQDQEVAICWQTADEIFETIFQRSIAKLKAWGVEGKHKSNENSAPAGEEDKQPDDEYEPKRKQARLEEENDEEDQGNKLSLISKKEPSSLLFKSYNGLWSA